MARRVWPYVSAALLAGLAGCSNFERPQRPAWRGQAEAACLAEKRVRASSFIRPVGEVQGPGICGMDHGFKVTALADGAVSFAAPITLACPALAEMDRWVTETVLPAAQARFGQPVVGLAQVGGYACRGMNNQPGARLSEHAFGNAFDVGGFKLADGRTVTLARHWNRGEDQERAFLRDIYAEGCDNFSTALGPGAAFHADHIHLDLARHGNTSSGPRRVCNPKPDRDHAPLPTVKDHLPDPPEIEDEIDVASAPPPQSGGVGRPGASLALSAPPPPPMRAQAPPASLPVPRSLIATGRPLPPVAIAPTPAPRPQARPMQLRAPQAGSLREDGAFVPEGDPADWDVTSSIRRLSRQKSPRQKR